MRTQRIGFVLLPGFSMIAYASATDALRLTNRTIGSQVFSCENYSIADEVVIASNETPVLVSKPVSEVQDLDTIFVCGGIDVQHHADKVLLTRLRRLASHGTGIGALCTGTYVLAKAGLLDGYRCTIHWENIASLIEDYPDLDVTSELFEIDRNRFTCAGGTAAADMVLSLIATHYGGTVAASVSDEMIHHRIRDGHESQRMELRTRLGVAHPKLLAVIQLMEENLEEPMSCADLAESVGLSTRQLERLFSKYLGSAPTRYYLTLRLERARYLLRQTSLPILSVALAAGFVSASHFSKCYREFFKKTPSEERRADSNASGEPEADEAGVEA